MQIDAPDPWWDAGRKIAELGPTFMALVGFIVANAMGKIVWGREAKVLEARIAKLEADNTEMLGIVKANGTMTTAAIEGFHRAMNETQRVRDELVKERAIEKGRRRT